MKYTYTAAALASFILAAPALAYECAKACTDAKNACLARPGSNKSTCAAEYADCLGYNPYERHPYVEPTACHKTTKWPTHTPTYPDWCAKECIEKHNECLRRPGSNKSTCAAEFAECLGYNPYDRHPYVEPTTCHKDPKPTHTHGHGDWCAKKCIEKHNECLRRPGSNKSTCAAEFAECLGYNPYDTHPYVEPTACHHKTTKKPTHTPAYPDWCARECIKKRDECLSRPGSNKSTCAAEFASCLGYNPYDTHPYVEPTACHHKTTVKPTHTVIHGDRCAKECIREKDECLARPGSNKSTCIAEFASCLGYNPYDKHPYVEPTACFEGCTKSTRVHTATATATGTSPPVVVVAGGDGLKPAMALLILGVAAFL